MAAPTPSNRIEERSGHASCVRADADLPPVAILGRFAVLFLGSPISVMKVVGVGLIVVGVVTLNLAGAH